MKYLENLHLETLSSQLSVTNINAALQTRIESYSCKMVQNDKRAFRDFLANMAAVGKSPMDREALSPPVNETPWSFAQSPSTLAPPATRTRTSSNSASDADDVVMCESISQKLLFHLITLLNQSYSDYDFTDARGEDFCRVDADAMRRRVDPQLLSLVPQRTLSRMWAAIDAEIHTAECIIYSYNPDYVSDPFSEDGALWSFNFLLYNKRLKRILFLACQASSILGAPSVGDSYGDLDSTDGSDGNNMLWSCE